MSQSKSSYYTILKGIIEQYRNVTLVYGQGNAGDGLIQLGIKKFFDSCELDSITYLHRDSIELIPRIKKQSQESLLCFAGSGVFIDKYPDACQKIVSAIKNTSADILFMPCTISSKKIFASLERVKQDVYVFCREEVSFETVRSSLRTNNCHVLKCHDMAFFIDAQETLITYQAPQTFINYSGIRATLAKYSHHLWQGTSNIFRYDSESSGIKPPLNNIDLPSAIIANLDSDGHYTFDLMNQRGLRLLQEINKCEAVRTDRLHVSIACHLLGIPCQLHAGNYYKNLAVFEFSMKSESSVRFTHHPASQCDSYG